MSRTLPLLLVLAGAMACASAPDPPESAPRSGFITSPDRVDLHYTILGEGADTVVMPLESWWRPHVATLAGGRTLILYDPRDRGRSDPVSDSTRLGLEYEIRDLEAVRRFFALEHMDLIGWSYLGGVSALYAARHPDRVGRLVLHAPVPPRLHPHVPGIFADMASRADTALDRLVAEAKRAGMPESDPVRYCELDWRASVARQLGSPEALDRVMSAGFCEHPNEWPANFGFRHVLRSMGQWDWREQVAAFKGPVLVVHGAQDNMPLEGSREWVEAFPDASLLVVEEAGHFPLLESESDVAEAIDRFLAGREPHRSAALAETHPTHAQVREEEVRIPVDSGITLAGTLVLPRGNGPFPAVVLLSTSLAEDRDATTGGFRPLRILADNLAAAGIGSIRWDDRGIGQSTGKHTYQYTTEDLANDALKAIELLKGREEVNPEGIGLSGISFGGILSSIVAAHSADVRFIVPLSGVASDPVGVNIEYRRRMLANRGLPASELEALMDLDRRAIEVSLTGAGKEELAADMRAGVRRDWERLSAEERGRFQDFDDYFQQSWYGLYLPFIGTPFYRSFLELDMRSALEGVTCPAYFVFGGNDDQIVAADAAPMIAEAMEIARNDDWSIRVFPGAGHYLTRPWGTFAPGLLDSITTWITDHTAG